MSTDREVRAAARAARLGGAAVEAWQGSLLPGALSLRPEARVARTTFTAGRAVREAIGDLVPGVRVVGITKGRFSILDLVEELLRQTGPAALTVSTWTPGAAEMERVFALLGTGLVTGFRLLVDRSFPGRKPHYAARVAALFGAGAVRLTRTHAKFALVSSGAWRITVRTSMNFNANPRLEQFDLDDDDAIFTFFDGVVAELERHVPAGVDADEREVEDGFRALGRRGDEAVSREAPASVVTAEELEGLLRGRRWTGG